MRVKVKICGIRHLESAQTALSAGADFLGFNFVNSSRRFVNPIQAKSIIDKVRKKIGIVGVFQNATVDEVNEHIHYLKLDFVQLHGKEDKHFVKKIKAEVIKAFPLPENKSHEEIIKEMRNYAINYFLLDREQQGKGNMVNIEKAAAIAKTVEIFYSGGLDHINVLEIIRKVKPFGVDIARGIETNGVADLRKIRLFITNAKGVV